MSDGLSERSPIAVVGIGCRLPGGVRSAADFWALLDEGRDAIVDIPSDRWSRARFYEPQPTPGKSRVSRGGFLTDPVDQFDPGFFGISPIEANSMDPQQRLLLEVAWEAIEDAGLRADELERSQTSVFTGGFTLDYGQMQFSTSPGEPPTVAPHTATGVVMTMLSNRLSHAFDLLGPSMSVDTACSSSLVAIHLACQSLWRGESDLAIAGGVNLMLSPNFTIAASTGGFLSPTSTSRAFDADANGYVRGEGAALVMLKPLAAAQADGDRIYATVLGTAVSQDGRTNGITVPNGKSQKRAMASALADAGVAAHTVSYVEAHGTGTPVGDPIEANAIGETYRAGRDQHDRLLIGSVKTNLGHLEAAAGAVGFIKSALTLAHRHVPRHLHLQTLNAAIDLDALRMRIATEPTGLPVAGPIRAAVNSFGFGGTNAHAVLESAPADTAGGDSAIAGGTSETGDSSHDGINLVLPIAARSDGALIALADRYADQLTADATPSVASWASLLAHRRSSHRQARLAVIAGAETTTVDALRAAAADSPHPQSHSSHPASNARPLAFVYTGMGPQWWAMARGLITNNPTFRAAIDRCDTAILPLTGWSVTAELLANERDSRLEQSDVAQITNFGVQYALTELWETFGVRPDLIVGHSAGEVAAALAAGALSFEDAVTVIVHRAQIQHTASGGGRLLAVALSEDSVRLLPEVANGTVEIAAVNSVESIAVVGETATLEAIAARLTAEGVFARMVPGDVPYHSRSMDPLENDVRQRLHSIAPKAATIPLYSTVTGQLLPTDGSQLHDAEYWWRNIRQPVLFGAAATAMLAQSAVTFVEIGPAAVLGRAIADLAAESAGAVEIIASLSRKDDDSVAFARALAALWVRGIDVDFAPLVGRTSMQTLPSYPWQRSHHWAEGESGRRERLAEISEPYLGNRTDSASLVWRRILDGTAPKSLADHVVHGAPLFPGAGFIEIAAEVARAAYDAHTCTLSDIAFESALAHGSGSSYLVETSLNAESGRIEIHGRAPESARWIRHAGATLRSAPAIDSRIEDKVGAGTVGALAVDENDLYSSFAAAGFEYGPAFRLLHDVQIGEGVARAKIRPTTAEPIAAHEPVIEPSVLDAAFQLLLPLAFQADSGQGREKRKLIPVGVERVVIHRQSAGPWVAHARTRITDTGDSSHIAGDVTIATEDGRVLIEVEGFTVRVLDEPTTPLRVGSDWVYEQSWHPLPIDENSARRTLSGTWLVLADGTGLADQVATELISAGGSPVLLPASDPALLSDRGALAAALDRTVPDEGLRGIIHLWANDFASADTKPALRRAAHDVPLSIVHLAAELDRRGLATPTFIVTSGAQPIEGEMSEIGLLQAPVLGVGRVLHHELLGMESRLVDLDPHDRSSSIDLLVQELALESADEDQIAFRGLTRMVPRLNPSDRAGGRIPARMETDGAYLVTGGLGALGQLVIRWLAERGAGHIIITSRAGLPARETWDALPSGVLRDAVATVIAAEAAGAVVYIESVDVTDASALRASLVRLQAEGVPPLRGVIHSAGAVEDQILIRLTDDQFDRVVRPKVFGAWSLHEATANAPLDFFVLFSSISAVIPSPGQGNYAAGNAYLDSLAHYRRSRNLAALSINWGPWDAGMIAALDLRALYSQRGIDLIDPTTGMALLGEMIGSREVQQGVVSAHWPTVIANYALTPVLVEHLGQAAETEGDDGTSVRERFAAAAPGDKQAIVVDGVRQTVSRVLRMAEEHVNETEPLGRMGMDSMIASELRIRLEQQFGTAPSIAFILEGASVASIAADVAAALEQLFTTEPGNDGADDEVNALASQLADLDEAELAALLADVTQSESAGGETVD